MNDPLSAGMQRVADDAARKGVTFDIRLMRASTLTDEELAVALGVALGQIVKTVVCLAPRPGGRVIPVVCLVSGRNCLDLALLAAVTGEARVREATAQEVDALFGCPRGDVPPIGHPQGVRIVMDQSLGRSWLGRSAPGSGVLDRSRPWPCCPPLPTRPSPMLPGCVRPSRPDRPISCRRPDPAQPAHATTPLRGDTVMTTRSRN